MCVSVSNHPYRNVAIAAVHNTKQARTLPGYDNITLQLEAALGVIAKAGLKPQDIDGVAAWEAGELIYDLGIGPAWASSMSIGIGAVLNAANAVAAGAATSVLVVDGAAGEYTERDATAPWTRPENEFTQSVGMYTAVQFALVARRHMEVYGTQPEHLARVAATIRNNGHMNPEAAYFGRGPYTVQDILDSRMIADPFHVLDCAMTSEGGCGLIVTTADRALDMALPPAYILGGSLDQYGPAYRHPPAWDLRSNAGDGPPLGFVGRRAAERAFSVAGLKPRDVDVCELYDAFSFEVIRQLEAFGFCGEGEGGPFVAEGNIDIGGKLPSVTDGGLMSYNHSHTAQTLQRVGRAVLQLQGLCATGQVRNAEVALASNMGAGAMSTHVILLGRERP
jgi:acetyl-CoA acetyltransferase